MLTAAAYADAAGVQSQQARCRWTLHEIAKRNFRDRNYPRSLWHFYRDSFRDAVSAAHPDLDVYDHVDADYGADPLGLPRGAGRPNP